MRDLELQEKPHTFGLIPNKEKVIYQKYLTLTTSLELEISTALLEVSNEVIPLAGDNTIVKPSIGADIESKS